MRTQPQRHCRRTGATALLASAALIGASITQAATPAVAQTKATSVPYTWRNVVITGGGFVDGIEPSPAKRGLMYCRTDIGGAYRWDSATSRWISISDWVTAADWNLTGIESLAVDPSDANRVYLAAGTYTNNWSPTNGAILRSDDQGRTWQRTDLTFKLGGNEDGRSIGERLAVDPNAGSILFMGTRNDGFWKSMDRGATWSQDMGFPITRRTNGIGIGFVVFDARSGKRGQPTPTVYVGVDAPGQAHLYRSRDAGATWEAVPGQPTGPSASFPHHAALGPDGVLYVTYGNGPGPNGMSDGSFWKWGSASGAWTDISPVHPNANGEHGFGFAGLAADAHHPGTVIVTTLDRWNPGDDVFRTTDGGAHWTSISAKAVRDDTLAPWLNWGTKTIRLGWWMGALALDPFDSGHALYGTGATVWATKDLTALDADQPTHWTVGAEGIEECVVNDVVSPPAGAPLLSTCWDIDGFRHVDVNASPSAGFFQPSYGRDTALAFAETDPNLVVRLFGGNNTHGAVSTDNGATWTPFGSAPAGTNGDGSIAIAANGSAFVWTPDGAGTFVSRDRGATWMASDGLPQRLAVVADRTEARRFYAADPASGLVYASTDGGDHFAAAAVQATLPAGAGTLRSAPGEPEHLWFAHEGTGLYRSTDGGATFSRTTGVDHALRIGFGKPAPNGTYPAIYLVGTVGGVYGIYRSDDQASTWVRVNDDQHQYGQLSSITGDPRVWGRVYIGSTNRGVQYGEPAR